MQIALPVTALILAIALFLDRRDQRRIVAQSEARAKDVASSKEITAKMEEIAKEMSEFKKRMEAITVKVGFKL